MTRNLPIDCVLDWMKAHHVPLNKSNYLHISYLGQAIPEGAEVPREVLAEMRAERRAIRRADVELLRSMGTAWPAQGSHSISTTRKPSTET